MTVYLLNKERCQHFLSSFIVYAQFLIRTELRGRVLLKAWQNGDVHRGASGCRSESILYFYVDRDCRK